MYGKIGLINQNMRPILGILLYFKTPQGNTEKTKAITTEPITITTIHAKFVFFFSV